MIRRSFSFLLASTLTGDVVFGWSQTDRRTFLYNIVIGGTNTAAFVGVEAPSNAESFAAEGELPMAVRRFTKLAPLNGNARGSKKFSNLSLEDIASRLNRDLSVGSTGKGSYIVTGDLSTDIFMDSCSFVDPTNKVDSLQQYQKALTILFDPLTSRVEILKPPTVHAADRTIRASYRCRGTLKLPWRPIVSAFESEIVWTVDTDTGLVSKQEQKWSKSAAEALRESFTPSFFDPPASSTRDKPSNEPAVVTKLFDLVNGRRDADYSVSERKSIEAWIDETKNLNAPFRSQLLPGAWRIVYLQPGTDGSGIDRRVPFPELPFNDSFQIFETDATSSDRNDAIRNVGEIFGPKLYVTVSGDLVEVESSLQSSRKRLQANIQGGKLCFSSDATCLDLPITGVGIFESIYLGDRLRIGQNINGGGALVVQVRMN